ncbi:hypothetical protein ACWDUM_26600 [Rhodococcus sp. NPDC003322]
MSTTSDREIVEEALGTFVRGHLDLTDGTRLDDRHFSLTLELGGRDVAFLAAAVGPDEARSLLPRLRRVVHDHDRLVRSAVEAVVRQFGDDPPSVEELADAHDDLVLDTVETHPGGDVVLHLADTCGDHFMDGYWPAVRLDPDDNVVAVTVES